MMAQYPDMFIMTFSIHIPNFVLLSQTAQLLLIFCYAAPLYILLVVWYIKCGVSSSGWINLLDICSGEIITI